MKFKILAGLSALMITVLFAATRKAALNYPADFRDAPRSAIAGSLGVQAPAGIPEPAPSRVSLSEIPIDAPANAASKTPCYLRKEPCTRLNSFYIVRKLRLKYDGNCSKFPIRFMDSPPGEVDWCNKMKKLYNAPYYYPSQLGAMCEAVHSDENMTSGDSLLNHVPVANIAVRESMKKSKTNCKTVLGRRSWYDSEVEVRYYAKPGPVKATSDQMPVTARQTGYGDGEDTATYVGDTLDNAMRLQINCERTGDAWRITNMSLIDIGSETSDSSGIGISAMFIGLDAGSSQSYPSTSVQEVSVQGAYCGGGMDTLPLPGDR